MSNYFIQTIEYKPLPVTIAIEYSKQFNRFYSSMHTAFEKTFLKDNIDKDCESKRILDRERQPYWDLQESLEMITQSVLFLIWCHDEEFEHSMLKSLSTEMIAPFFINYDRSFIGRTTNGNAFHWAFEKKRHIKIRVTRRTERDGKETIYFQVVIPKEGKKYSESLLCKFEDGEISIIKRKHSKT